VAGGRVEEGGRGGRGGRQDRAALRRGGEGGGTDRRRRGGSANRRSDRRGGVRGPAGAAGRARWRVGGVGGPPRADLRVGGHRFEGCRRRAGWRGRRPGSRGGRGRRGSGRVRRGLQFGGDGERGLDGQRGEGVDEQCADGVVEVAAGDRGVHQAAFTSDTAPEADDQPYWVAKRLEDIDKAEAGNITFYKRVRAIRGIRGAPDTVNQLPILSPSKPSWASRRLTSGNPGALPLSSLPPRTTTGAR
jgi:hypothetical protein